MVVLEKLTLHSSTLKLKELCGINFTFLKKIDIFNLILSTLRNPNNEHQDSDNDIYFSHYIRKAITIYKFIFNPICHANAWYEPPKPSKHSSNIK